MKLYNLKPLPIWEAAFYISGMRFYCKPVAFDGKSEEKRKFLYKFPWKCLE